MSGSLSLKGWPAKKMVFEEILQRLGRVVERYPLLGVVGWVQNKDILNKMHFSKMP